MDRADIVGYFRSVTARLQLRADPAALWPSRGRAARLVASRVAVRRAVIGSLFAVVRRRSAEGLGGVSALPWVRWHDRNEVDGDSSSNISVRDRCVLLWLRG